MPNYLVSCLQDQCSYFIACTAYNVLHIMKQMSKICHKNISKRKSEKPRNYLFKMKKINEIVPEKGLFTSVKGRFCLTKKALVWSRRESGDQILPHQKIFWHIWFELTKMFFFSKRVLFNRALDPGMFYHFKIGPGFWIKTVLGNKLWV